MMCLMYSDCKTTLFLQLSKYWRAILSIILLQDALQKSFGGCPPDFFEKKLLPCQRMFAVQFRGKNSVRFTISGF